MLSLQTAENTSGETCEVCFSRRTKLCVPLLFAFTMALWDEQGINIRYLNTGMTEALRELGLIRSARINVLIRSVVFGAVLQ